MNKKIYTIIMISLVILCTFQFVLPIFKVSAYENKGTNIIAHRGLSTCAPENTLPAFKIDNSYKIYGAECDIHETADGEFVVMHDSTVDRMTNGSGLIKNLNLWQIKNLKIDSGANINAYKNLKIPTLKEYLSTCREYGIIPIIEVKDIRINSIDRLLGIINEYNNDNKSVIISFNKDILSAIRNKNSNIKIAWLCDMKKENIDFCRKNKFDIDVSKNTFNVQMLNYAHKNNVKVNVWTVNDENFANMLIGYGVDYITSDDLRFN